MNNVDATVARDAYGNLLNCMPPVTFGEMGIKDVCDSRSCLECTDSCEDVVVGNASDEDTIFGAIADMMNEIL